MFIRPWVYVIVLVIIIALIAVMQPDGVEEQLPICLLYTSPSPRDS